MPGLGDVRADGADEPADGADQLLADALSAGDEAAFAWIVQTWSPALLRTALVITGDRRGADELLLATWSRVLRDVSSFRAPPRLKVWVWTVMLCVAGMPVAESELDAAPARGPTVDPSRFLPSGDPQWPGHWAAPPVAWPAAAATRPEQPGAGPALRDALDRLPFMQRVVVALRDAAGWEVAEISQLVHQRPELVRGLLHQARAEVRQGLEEHYVGVGAG